MASVKTPIKYEPKPLEKSFMLRLPDEYAIALDGLVEKGVAKSRNELIVHIIGVFLSDLKKKAEVSAHG